MLPKEMDNGRELPALGSFCICLGQLPIQGKFPPDFSLPEEWVSYSAASWEKLTDQAQIEGLAPLLYWILSESGKFCGLPEKVRQILRANYAGAWRKNQILIKELEGLSEACQQIDIPLVILKGACFALTIYPDIGLRPMGDLDLLVPGAKLSTAAEIARSLGYENSFPEASPGLNDLLSHEICLHKKGSPSISLELHHSLVADRSFQFAVPVDWFWEQTIRLKSILIDPRFENLFILTPIAQMLYAASHAMLQHGGKIAPLRWFYDLDRLVRTYSGHLDWDELLSQARIFEWGSALHAALLKTTAFFQTPIPEKVLSSLEKVSDRNQSLIAIKQTRPATHIIEEIQKVLSLKGNARFRLLLALTVPSPAYMRWRYGLKSTWAIPVYYMIRWWNILTDGIRSLISLFHRTPC